MVDDNPKNLQVLGNLLSNDGYSVEFALNGLDALDRIKKKVFDMILLDVMMPEMDGFEMCRILKADKKHKNIPVIFLSARTDMDYIIQGFDLGAVDYIYKPFNKQELLSRISTHFELKKSRDIIEQYAKDLEVKNKLITQSINYGKEIQSAVLLSGFEPLKEFREHFLLFKPKDIISGDFFWSYKIDDLIIIAMVDCTGHGVPGALMSMLGVAFLTETIVSEGITKTDVILNKLSYKIINALSQKGIIGEVHDGMDVTIISINLKYKTLEFSGAFNSVFLIHDDNLILLKGDRRSVGYAESMHSFTSHQSKLLKDDVIYMFTDGYPDQFGGEKDSKFKIQSFMKLLLEIHNSFEIVPV